MIPAAQKQRYEASEQLQIRICRVFCIFFMMSVHVNPGLSNASLVSTGSLAWLGIVWGDFLGRASVAALSFISGYLLIKTTTGRSLGSVVKKKFQTLIIPMLTWDLFFCGLLVAETVLLHKPIDERLVGPEVSALGALTGLTGPTANLSLFFLRDLFVSSVIVFILAPYLRRWPVLCLGGLAAIAVWDIAAPIVFRPTILLFVALGAVVASRSLSLRDIVRPPILLPSAGVLGAIWIGITSSPPTRMVRWARRRTSSGAAC